ncbi:Aste57867_9443 [Aphanomyces stellatus]|uniref:Aste57867_9443 protein n=1 Tax=Aphanomyces stellatus TaxID=120398 RepID=A0A485KN90_9STRA|nr:hypothetical protein As57867_009407 [Aphanomyces stellatus]VFT86323.1 Aste57867_9443 [Aphanomyces stellatus]
MSSPRYAVHPLPTGGVEVVVPACRHISSLAVWTAVHVPIAAAIPFMVTRGAPAQVIVVFAIPIVLALYVYLGWLLWQLRGIERYVVTPTSWTYESGLAGLVMYATFHYDLCAMGQLVVDGTPARFGFEGHLKMGVAFDGKDEIQTFLLALEPFMKGGGMALEHVSSGSPETTRLSSDDVPILDEMFHAMLPMLDLSSRDHAEMLARL